MWGKIPRKIPPSSNSRKLAKKMKTRKIENQRSTRPNYFLVGIRYFWSDIHFFIKTIPFEHQKRFRIN